MHIYIYMLAPLKGGVPYIYIHIYIYISVCVCMHRVTYFGARCGLRACSSALKPEY